ncbi:MAG: type II toxin-antitoxin system VapC family toxin [Gemmatimonadetes bacterium]|nr:type II toxin-antitoxin system VapC family toxin [Gemmatimonadota bacterium]
MASYGATRRPVVRRVSESALWRASRAGARTDGLLLDTHSWLWTLDGTRGMMSEPAVGLVASAAAAGRLFVSDMSFWEVSLKTAKGKLTLSLDPTLWLERAARAPGIQLLPVTRDVLIQSTRLPEPVHGDPVDRILLAQAQLLGLSLLTCDRLIVEYAAQQVGVPVCDARGKAG